MVILIIMVVLVFVGSVTLLFLTSGCPPKSYSGGFMNVTHYSVDKNDTWSTPKNIRVVAEKKDATMEFFQEIDKRTDELEACLLKSGASKNKINRKWFGVLVPKDWYISKCSGEQLVPSLVSYKLCEAKGLTIKEECRNLERPTTICPCVCSVRATIQDDFWIVTAPNLKLFKTELARLHTNKNAPWKYPEISRCL
jgi:hypothetical protein